MPYTGTGFSSHFGTGQFVEVPNPVPGRMFALLDFRSENRILVVTISTVSMRQDSPISICLVFLWGGKGGNELINYTPPIHPTMGLMAQPHVYMI